jgi:hypothetical protein
MKTANMPQKFLMIGSFFCLDALFMFQDIVKDREVRELWQVICRNI